MMVSPIRRSKESIRQASKSTKMALRRAYVASYASRTTAFNCYQLVSNNGKSTRRSGKSGAETSRTCRSRWNKVTICQLNCGPSEDSSIRMKTDSSSSGAIQSPSSAKDVSRTSRSWTSWPTWSRQVRVNLVH